MRVLQVYFFTVLCCASVWAQNVTIRGQGHEWYRGRAINIWQPADYITMKQVMETSDTIAEDRSFELQLYISSTRPVYIQIENFTAELYVQPDYVYAITLPEPDLSRSVNPEVELPLNIGIIGADSTELNALIFDYQRQYNKLFIPEDERFLSRAVMFKRVDSLEKICQLRYKNIHNDYFKSYVKYSIAAVNAAVSRGQDYLLHRYVLNQSVQHNHAKYMEFFNALFSGYIKGLSAAYPGQSVFNMINDKADYTKLTAFLRQEKAMNSDTLRELVCLNNFYHMYFTAGFNTDAIQSLLSQLLTGSNIEEHKQIARTMLASFGRLQPGSPAPDFSARNRLGKMASLGVLKGKWIYLNFFSSSNSNSMREMMKLPDLQKRYGHKVVFLSICLDDSVAAYEKLLRDNPKFNWLIWYNYDQALTVTAKEHYNVTGTEAYFLISDLGDIVQNPAVTPSQGIEYKFNTIFKIKQKTTRTGLR